MSLQGQNLTEKENDYIKGVHLQLKIDSILCFQDLLSKWKIYLYEILKYPTYINNSYMEIKNEEVGTRK